MRFSLRLLSGPALGLGGAALAALLASAVSAPPAAAAPAGVVFCPHFHCSTSLIQDAIDSAASGSTIGIGAGTYQGDGVIINKSVTLQAYGPVTIDAEHSASNPGDVLFITSSATVTIDGLTITGGYAQPSVRWGGGISNYGTLTVRNSVITGNNGATGAEGGGIYNGGDLTVIGTTITGNTAEFAGGIANYRVMVLRGSRVTDNSASYNGGGLDNAYGAVATISGTVFSGNSSTLAGAGLGGAIDNYESTLTVDNSVIVDNSATKDGGGIFSWAGTTPASTVSLGYDLIVGNTPDNCAGDASC